VIDTKDLIAQLETVFVDPDKRTLLAHVAADAVTVAARALIDPEGAAKEALHIRAQLSNLTAAEVQMFSSVLASWAARVVFTAIVAG
jgi:FixJ family two-component response regulator